MAPFREGLKAFREGNLGNPYEVNTQDHRDFEFGFNKAYFSNKKRQEDYERKTDKTSSKLHGGNTRKA
mgnify:CR=1 FL=1